MLGTIYILILSSAHLAIVIIHGIHKYGSGADVFLYILRFGFFSYVHTLLTRHFFFVTCNIILKSLDATILHACPRPGGVFG